MHRRDRKKPTRRQRQAAVMTSVFASLFAAAIGAASATGFHTGTVAKACAIAGLAFIGGLVLARVVGRQGRI